MMAKSADYDIAIQQNVPATMRDGTILRADIYHPKTDEALPVLLCRTPYDKQCDRLVNDATRMAKQGYIVVVQDVRGRYASEGKFLWMFDFDYCEDVDGYDSVEWAATLPGSTGKVGTFGLSYDAWVQWELATLRPPSLVAMAPSGIPPRVLDLTYGIFETGRRLRWFYTMSPDYRVKDGLTTGPQTRDEAKAVWNHMEREKWIWYLPLDELPAEEIFYGFAAEYRDYLRHQNIEYWRFPELHREVNVPVFATTGWYDRTIGTMEHITGMMQNGTTKHARRNQKLLVGPWSHTTDFERQVGMIDFGPEAEQSWHDMLKRWFDYWLKGIANGVMDEPPISLFIMGDNVWRNENEWPLARTVYTNYYFHSHGSANTPLGDGWLNPSLPGDEPVDSYVYDPKDPVMSLATLEVQDAPFDQHPLDHRRDVLVFTTEPLQQDMEVTGPIVIKLFAASTAPDTDFTAKLIDVYPNGTAISLCYGIIRAQYRESYQNPGTITPGEVYEYTLELRATANVFKKGHCIRVDISSSDFPLFDRNHNTGRPFYSDTELVKAGQTIYHNSQYPSRVILPIIP